MKEAEIRSEHKEIHDEITAEYYLGPKNYPGGKKGFDAVHGENWQHMEEMLIAEGYMDPPGPSLEDRVKALEDAQLR